VAIVELDEKTGLRLTSHVLNCGIDDAAIGMPVTVGFIAHLDIWYLVFIPWTAEPNDWHVIRADCCDQRSGQSIICRHPVTGMMILANAL